MKLRTRLSLLAGAVVGGGVGWLAFAWSIVRDDPAQGVGMILIGAVYGVFVAVIILTKGTCDFNSQRVSGKGSSQASGAGGAAIVRDVFDGGADGGPVS
jgi:hypothetical protein